MEVLKNKNKILTGILIVLCIVLAVLGILMINQNTLKQTNDTWTQEAGQEPVFKPSDFFDVDEEKASQITFDTSKLDINNVGEYTVTANFKKKTFEIKVKVEDTTAPVVEISNRCIFTNAITDTDFTGVLSSVYDASEWSAKLLRFEPAGTLQVMDEVSLKALTDTIPLPCDEEELKRIGTEDIPTEEGIYRAVMEISDAYGNATLEEVYVIYDTTGAKIEDMPDKTISVAEEDLENEPTIDKADYTITDNVDGAIDSENIQCELELRNAENHEWLVQVSYTDRAGNDSRAEFLITVQKETVADKKQTSNTETNTTSTTNQTTSENNTASGNNTSNETYDPADKDKDGVVTPEESLANLSPTKQLIINAGIGNVVQVDSTSYALCVPYPDYPVNGKSGDDALREYLANIGLEPSSLSGGWMTSDYYCYSAEGVHEIDTSGLEWTDNGEIEFID